MHSKLGTRSKLLPRHTEDMLDPQWHLSKAGIFSVVFLLVVLWVVRIDGCAHSFRAPYAHHPRACPNVAPMLRAAYPSRYFSACVPGGLVLGRCEHSATASKVLWSPRS